MPSHDKVYFTFKYLTLFKTQYFLKLSRFFNKLTKISKELLIKF
jgi:hypothetical protein